MDGLDTGMVDSFVASNLAGGKENDGTTKQAEVGETTGKRHGMLTKDNMKLPRKRPGALKYVRAFVKLIAEMASDGTGAEVFGELEVMMQETLLRCDDRGGSV